MIVFLLTPFLSNSQKNLSQEQFKKVVDNITCLCINVALGNSAVDCGKTTIQENDIPTKETKTLDLYKEFQKLKNTTNNKELTISFLTNEVFSSPKYEKIKAFADQRRGYVLEDIIDEINKAAISVTNQSSDVTANDNQISDQTGQDYNSKSTSQVEQKTAPVYTDNINPKTKTPRYGIGAFMKDYGFSFILFIMLITLFIYLKRRDFASKKYVDSKVKNNEKNKEVTTITYPIIPSNNGNRVLEDSLNILKDKIRSLEDKIKYLEIKATNETPAPIAISEVPKTPIMQLEDKIFYKHAPHERGYFDTDDNVNLNDAVFKFIVNTNNPNNATFEIITEKKKLILDYPNKYIKPVCIELNALNQSANNITIVPGTVEKRENQWIVKTKIQIKYE